MKKITFILSGITLFALQSIGQTWTPIYTYNVQHWADQARVDVSKDDKIFVSMKTTQANRPLERSLDGGQTFTQLKSNFIHEYIGFTSDGKMYVVNGLKLSGGALTKPDSLYYSTDWGDTFQNLFDVPENNTNEATFFIDYDDNFYTPNGVQNANQKEEIAYYKNGALVGTIPSFEDLFGTSLRGLIKLSNGNFVASTYNDGVKYSTDNGQTWVSSQNDGDLGTSTFTVFAEANNGTLFLAGVSLVECSDGGETWAGASLNKNFVSTVKKAGNGTLVAIAEFSTPKFYESTDNGATWVGMQNEPTGLVKDFDVSTDYIYAVFSDSVLYKAQLSSGIGINEDALGNAQFTAFPNPTNSTINVRNTAFSGQAWQVTITNQAGQIVHKSWANTAEIALDRNALPTNGLYTVSIQNKQHVTLQTIKIIKAK